MEKRESFTEENELRRRSMEFGEDLMAVEEFEIEELSVDGICGVY